jgi:bifunctional DNA-binding transcriptional regulator/antitoxin component of YhaV-PrlF toxin-antitoxin module
MGGDLKPRGVVISNGRITIHYTIRKQLQIKDGDFYEQEAYGNDKVLVTFFKTKNVKSFKD